MAYFSQEMKKERVAKIKKIFSKYGVKGTFGVRHHSTFVINITEGKFFFEKDHFSPSNYWLEKYFKGEVFNFFKEIFAAANEGNHDRSDIMTDYFDVGYYVNVNVGKWDKPYVCTA